MKLGDVMKNYFEFYCEKCNKLLGKVKSDAEIICPRCGGINQLNYKAKEIKYITRLRKAIERTSSSGKRFN
jgi:phage FluMu protein Com